jgi:hypothetical protein
MTDELRLCRRCQQPISAERLEEVPVARFCESCLRPRPCQRCKQMIDLDRLEAIPETRLCGRCSRETGGDIRLKVSTTNTRKAGSLKQTGTDIGGTEIVRRDLPPEEVE